MTSARTPDPMVASVLDGRYEILAKLARGGMATVYRARDNRLHRTVAVKIMRTDLGEDDEFAAKFDREARSAALINHPAVVSIFDQGISRGQPYIVMEYIEGETLRRLIAREAPLEPMRALDLLEPIASALAAAHEAGIVHRDIKPENVLLSARGQIKVADFGLARETASPQMTATGVLVGTASYLPPELVTHARPDARSDIYSTGIVLFELLTGKKPHVGENNYQIAYAHVNTDVPAPSQKLRELGIVGFIPDYVDALVAACTARDPQARIADGRELSDSLRRVRTELLRYPDRHNPALAAALRPEPTGEIPTQTISPRPEPRPRPLSELPTAPIRPSSPNPTTVYPPEARTEIVPTAAAMPQSEPSPTPASQRTPLFPNLNLSLSQDPVYRRRRGAIMMVLLLVVTTIIAVSSWWWAEGRFTTTPDVSGQGREQAIQTLTANDLQFTTVEDFSETVASGSVISTDPAGGLRLPRGSTVTIVISKGPERYAMPTVVGLTKEEATAAIEGANLTLGKVSEEYSASVAAGTVISASAEAETLLPKDTAIDLQVSLGPEPIKITNYEGTDASTAQQELSAAGFSISTTAEHSATVPEGSVISQDPNSGTGHHGDTIRLVTSLGPEMVTVPVVKYLTVDKATKTLESAGFTVQVEQATELPAQIGLVTYTVPAGGTQAPKGSTVIIYET